MARVSVILPVFNGASTVGRALASVFAQTFTDYEIVAVNDGSTDDTASVLSGYGDRIRVVTQSNRGLSAARNAGIHASQSDYVAFIDDDDEWMPEKLARCVPILDDDPNCALAYTAAVRVDLTGKPMPIQTSQDRGIDSPTTRQMLERPWNVVPSQFVVRRPVMEACGGFDERFVSTCEDLYFLLLAREYGYFRGVAEPMVRKTTRPLFPKALNREPQCDLFCRLVRERYGKSASGLIREFRQSRMKVMKHMARMLLEEGRAKDARRCLARVIHYQPTSPKAYRRYLKTFLPARMPHTTKDSEA